MPIPFAITAISGSYPDIAANYHEKTYLILISIFTLRANQSHHNDFVAARVGWVGSW
jgi:hypothetical protein